MARFELGGKQLRALLITDLHFGFARFGHELLLARIGSAHAHRPFDIVLLGGDYIDSSLAYLPQLERWLTELGKLGLPTYAVLGDHDHVIVDYRPIRDLLEKLGVVVLQSETADFRGHTILGVSELRTDPEYDSLQEPRPIPGNAKARMRLIAAEFPLPALPPKPAIVLCHNPDIIFSKSIPEGSLVLAGHSHGGQMWPLSWLGEKTWPILPGGSFGCWAGIRTIEKKTLLVSRGAGSSWKPFRFLCRPEIWVIDIE